MVRLVWDAGGLAKRYVPEVGTATVVALWQSFPIRQMAATFAEGLQTLNPGLIAPADVPAFLAAL